VIIEAQTLLCGTELTAHILEITRIIPLLTREFDGLLNTALLKCQVMSVTMAPVIYKYILHNSVISEKFA
jgi:hypothetical protein